MITLVPASLSYLEFCHREQSSYSFTPIDVVEKQKGVIEKAKRRNKMQSDRIMISSADFELFKFEEQPPNPPAIDRWNNMSLKARNWLLNRIENVEQYEQSSDDENQAGTCFFCGDRTVHVNGGGNAWWAAVKKKDGDMATVSYCINHKGPERSSITEEAENGGFWYEEGSYDIIGFEGHKFNISTNPNE